MQYSPPPHFLNLMYVRVVGDGKRGRNYVYENIIYFRQNMKYARQLYQRKKN